MGCTCSNKNNAVLPMPLSEVYEKRRGCFGLDLSFGKKEPKRQPSVTPTSWKRFSFLNAQRRNSMTEIVSFRSPETVSERTQAIHGTPPPRTRRTSVLLSSTPFTYSSKIAEVMKAVKDCEVLDQVIVLHNQCSFNFSELFSLLGGKNICYFRYSPLREAGRRPLLGRNDCLTRRTIRLL
jgi:hypothetical protein